MKPPFSHLNMEVLDSFTPILLSCQKSNENLSFFCCFMHCLNTISFHLIFVVKWHHHQQFFCSCYQRSFFREAQKMREEKDSNYEKINLSLFHENRFSWKKATFFFCTIRVQNRKIWDDDLQSKSCSLHQCGHQAQEHWDVFHIEHSHWSTLLINCFMTTKGKVLYKYKLLLLPFSEIYGCISSNFIILMKTSFPCQSVK